MKEQFIEDEAYMDEALWGTWFGMKGEDFFREGAGIDEKAGTGRLTLCDYYPRKDERDPFFPFYEAVVDEMWGMVSVTGVRKGIVDRKSADELFDRELSDLRGSWGKPLAIKRRPDTVRAFWKTQGFYLMLTLRPDTLERWVIELQCASPLFSEIWRGRAV